MKSVVLILFTFQSIILFSQDLYPPCEWSNSGVVHEDEKEAKTIDFKSRKAELGGNVTDDQVLESILSFQSEAVIFFPAGDYHFKKQIRLKSNCSFGGAGKESRLHFDLEKDVDPILVQGKITTDTFSIGHGLSRGEGHIDFKFSNSKISRYSYYLLIDDDEAFVKSWWARGKTGQIIEVIEVKEGRVRLRDSLRRDYGSEVKLVKLQPVQQIVISNISIINESKTSNQTSNICFRYAAKCQVIDVFSYKANYAHICLEFSTNCGIFGSSFSGAQDYGNGGKGYGVAFQFATSSSSLEQSKFDSLRHSILLQAGANGNYIAHNESTNPYWTDVKLPATSAGDIVLHGNFPYANLIEMNKCKTIVIDKSHGMNGPYNTFFNNEVSGYGIWQLKGSSCGPQYWINNKVIGEKGRYKLNGDFYEQYNQFRDNIYPSDSKENPARTMRFGGLID